MPISRVEQIIKPIWVKNGPDIRAALSGTLPAFLQASSPAELTEEIPVFVYHAVEPERFERQLKYLADNGYRTVNSDTLAAALKGEIKVHP